MGTGFPTDFPEDPQVREGMIKALSEVIAVIDSGESTVKQIRDLAFYRMLNLLPSEYWEYCEWWRKTKDIPEIAPGPLLSYPVWQAFVTELTRLAALGESISEEEREDLKQLRKQLILLDGTRYVTTRKMQFNREELRVKLTNHITPGGSREFATLPPNYTGYSTRDHVMKLPGAKLTSFITDCITESWIDFTYRGHNFTLNDPWNDYYCFVEDPACPDDILVDVVEHFLQLLEPQEDSK